MGLFSLVALALLAACSSPAEENLDFPLSSNGDKEDVFGRSLIGRASPYVPDLSLSDPDTTQTLREDMGLRRKVAWQTVFKILEPVPLLGLAELSEEHPDAKLANGDEIPKLPRFQSWYGVSDAKRIFKRIYDTLGPSGRRARSVVSEELMNEAFDWNESAVERSSRWPLDRYLDFVRELGVCPDDLSAEECAQTLSSKLAGAASGNSRILYSPGTIAHIMSNYGSILDCIDTLETLPMNTVPNVDTNFTACFAQEFPADAVLVKAQWVRADIGTELPAFDTDADALTRRLSGTANWGEDGDRKVDPSPSDIYTIRLQNGNVFRLVGLHIMTKEMRHWQWITLWWSDKPDKDFGADRPAQIRESLPSIWSNYKMCAVSHYFEQDSQILERFQELPTLRAALVATGGEGETTWCSNPYMEHGQNNAGTNCIGCHQHGGSRVAYDLDGDDILDPLDLEMVIGNDFLFPDIGRLQIRNQFPADYLYSFNRVDDLAGMIDQEVQFFDDVDKNSVADRIVEILAREGNAENGARNFAAYCAPCHGGNGLGTSFAPSLAERVPARDDEELLQSILRGRGDMPAWEQSFVDQEFADLRAYLRQTF